MDIRANRLFIILITLFTVITFTSCDKDGSDDWSEVINLYVDDELGEYRPWGHPECAKPLDGLKIKEREDDDWDIIPIDGIEGFTYSLGWKYRLEVEKIHLANPPADASSTKYRLIKIIDEQRERIPAFPTLEVKGAYLNTYTANIFEPVHFYLQGNDYMQQDLKELCDSLVFNIPWQKGSRLSRKIYFNENGSTELINSWEHRFILPYSGVCTIKAYKGGEVVYNDGVAISLTNNNDFLMYDWLEITNKFDHWIAYVNFVDIKHQFISTHYFVADTPIAKISLSLDADDTLEWLYNYISKLYKAPLYDSTTGVQEQYRQLFTDIDTRETPLYIWIKEHALFALIHWYNADTDLTQYYIKAEPVK